MSKVEKEMPIEKAFEVARKYCDENGYDFDKIKELDITRKIFGEIGQEIVFYLPSEHPELVYLGLMADRETRFRVVLWVQDDYSVITGPWIEQFRK